MQGSVIALGVGYSLRNASASLDTAWWPYVLFVYALLASVVPWIAGSYVTDYDEFHPRFSFILGLIFALPVWLASRWLIATPYTGLVIICWMMIALWLCHMLVSIILWLKKRGDKPRTDINP